MKLKQDITAAEIATLLKEGSKKIKKAALTEADLQSVGKKLREIQKIKL